MLTLTNGTIDIKPVMGVHVHSLFQLIIKNKEHLYPWFPWVDYMIESEEHLRNFIVQAETRYQAGLEIAAVIEIKGKVIGRIGLYEIDAQNRCASIGYWLDKEYEGRGIITESCKLLIDYAYTSLPVNRIEIRCATNNLRSKNIPIKLGFKLDGILRSGEFIHHSFHDLYNFSMLKNEWK